MLFFKFINSRMTSAFGIRLVLKNVKNLCIFIKLCLITILLIIENFILDKKNKISYSFRIIKISLN